MNIELSPDQVSALMNQMPEAARGVSSGIVYTPAYAGAAGVSPDPENSDDLGVPAQEPHAAQITIPDAFADAATAIMAKDGWESYTPPAPATPQEKLAAFIATLSRSEKTALGL